jgi:lactate dehydrogenase-like 2-hydroxyacid dehydrogenase
MRIGIIGAGMIGETLARRIGQVGHQVAIANSRGPETLRDLASQVGATAVTTSTRSSGYAARKLGQYAGRKVSHLRGGYSTPLTVADLFFSLLC